MHPLVQEVTQSRREEKEVTGERAVSGVFQERSKYGRKCEIIAQLGEGGGREQWQCSGKINERRQEESRRKDSLHAYACKHMRQGKRGCLHGARPCSGPRTRMAGAHQFAPVHVNKQRSAVELVCGQPGGGAFVQAPWSV